MDQNWKNDPKLKSISREKLDMLQTLAENGMGKSPGELMPYIMSVITQNQKNSFKFSPEEISVIIEVLKSGKTPREAEKLDRIVSLMKNIRTP